MAFFRKTLEEYDEDMAAGDELRIVAVNNPTLIGDELIVLAGTVAATTKYETAGVASLRAQRTRGG